MSNTGDDRAYKRAWDVAHYDRKLAYRAKDPEKWRAYKRAWSAANRERLREQQRLRHAANPENKRARQRAWDGANRDKRRAYYMATPERWRAYTAAYNAANGRVDIAGERVRITALPKELQPIARLIYETRRELKKRREYVK